MPRPRLALPLVLALLAAGCGGAASSAGDFEGEEANVADTVERLESAGQSGDADVICDEVLAESLRDRMRAGDASCEQELEQAIADADDFALTVEDVAIQGTRATARVRAEDSDGERVRTFELVREGSSWRASSLGS